MVERVNKGSASRCANCGLGFTAEHKGCRIRLQVEKAVLVGTHCGLKK